MGEYDLDNWFTYHPPFGGLPARYEAIRAGAKAFAEVIAQNAPYSRESSTAMQYLRSASMWANAAIACNEFEPTGE